jgi:hypothetical protein
MVERMVLKGKGNKAFLLFRFEFFPLWVKMFAAEKLMELG